MWDAETGREVVTLWGHTGEVMSVAFSPDGKLIASASPGQDSEGVGPRRAAGNRSPWPGPYRSVKAVAFSPDGKRLASGGDDGNVRAWDFGQRPGGLLLRWPHPQVTGVAFSPDGKLIASAGSDKTVKVWDAATGREAFALEGHGDEIDGRGL